MAKVRISLSQILDMGRYGLNYAFLVEQFGPKTNQVLTSLSAGKFKILTKKE